MIVITTAEIARTTNKTTAGHMVVHGRIRTQGQVKNVETKRRHGRGINTHTHNGCQALGILETIREEDEAEKTTCVFDMSDTGKWIREEAVIDSSVVGCVTSKKRMPHLRVEETPGSRRGETWKAKTDLGTMKRGIFKVGPVSRTVISVDRFQETGHDDPHEKQIMHRQLENRRGHAAVERRRHVHSRHVDLGAEKSHENRKLLEFSFFASIHYDSTGRDKSSQRRPRKSMFRSGRHTGCKEIISHDDDILSRIVDGEALEEGMECEHEDETVQFLKTRRQGTVSQTEQQRTQ